MMGPIVGESNPLIKQHIGTQLCCGTQWFFFIFHSLLQLTLKVPYRFIQGSFWHRVEFHRYRDAKIHIALDLKKLGVKKFKYLRSQNIYIYIFFVIFTKTQIS